MEFLENILTQAIVQRLGWVLVHFVWQAATVALVLAILLKMLRKSSANLRYIVTCLALVAVVLLPVVTMSLIGVDESYSQLEAAVIPASELEPVAFIPTPVEIERSVSMETPAIEAELAIESVAAAPGIPLKQRITDVLEPNLAYLVMAWLVGVFGLSVWYLGGWTQLQKLKRKMVKPVDESLQRKLKELQAILGVNRAIDIVESALVESPAVVGWLKPVILLPVSILTGFSAEQIEAILAHELAHIKRCDYLVNMLQTGVEILGFYHPAVWWISKKIRVERENCCDDIAVKVSGDKIGYAKTLALFEGIKPGQSDLAVAASGGSLFQRICRLVQKDSITVKADWKPSFIAALLVIALLIPTGFALTAGSEEKLDVQVKEEKRVTVKGQVVGPDGKPVTDARIFLGGISSRTFGGGPPVSKIRTDENGQFTITDIDKRATHLLVSTPWLDVWNAPLPQSGDDILINLPKPATLKIRCNFKGSDVIGTFRLELETWKMDGWKELAQCVRNVNVANRSEIVLTGLTPGSYDIARTKTIHGNNHATTVYCDRKLDFALDAGSTTVLNYTRKDGSLITGFLTGLPDTRSKAAYVYVKSPEATGDPRKFFENDEWRLTTFDGVVADTYGKFTTEMIPPGTYTIVAHSFEKREGFRSGIQLPDFVGTAKIVVSEKGEASPVEIKMKSYGPRKENSKNKVFTAPVEIKGLEAFNLFDLKKTKPSDTLNSRSEEKAIEATDFKATLDDGVKIELLGLSRIPVKDSPWWKADGSSLKTPLFDKVSNEGDKDRDNDKFDNFAFAMRVSGIERDDIGSIKWNFNKTFFASSAEGFLKGEDVYYDNIRVAAARFAKGAESTDLRLGIVCGKWKTIASGRDSVYKNGSDLIFIDESAEPLISQKTSGSKGTRIGVTYNVTGREFRIVAVDKKGKLHVSQTSGSLGVGAVDEEGQLHASQMNLRITEAFFPDMPNDQLKEYRFQTRDYQWVEFKNVSLKPDFNLATNRFGDVKALLQKIRKAQRPTENMLVEWERQFAG